MKTKSRKLSLLLATTAVVALFQAGTASAGIISFDLSNKGPGALADPDYGLRLDDLFDTPTESNWTFSFTDNGASVQMDVDTDNDTVHIFGTVYGGRDTGNMWDANSVAFWDLDFNYTHNVTIDDAVNGYWTVAYDADNFGYLRLNDSVDVDGDSNGDEGKFLGLADFHGGSFVGIGGPSPQSPFVSAWLESTDSLITTNTNLANETYQRPNNGNCCNDFGYRATQTVPEPTGLALLVLGIAAGVWQTRRRKSVQIKSE